CFGHLPLSFSLSLYMSPSPCLSVFLSLTVCAILQLLGSDEVISSCWDTWCCKYTLACIDTSYSHRLLCVTHENKHPRHHRHTHSISLTLSHTHTHTHTPQTSPLSLFLSLSHT